MRRKSEQPIVEGLDAGSGLFHHVLHPQNPMAFNVLTACQFPKLAIARQQEPLTLLGQYEGKTVGNRK